MLSTFRNFIRFVGNDEDAARERQGRPLAMYLFALVMLVLLPSIVFSIILIMRNDDARRTAVYSQAESGAVAVAGSFRREMDRMRYLLQLLSTKGALTSEEFETLHADAQTALAGSNTYFLVLDEAFNQILNTRFEYGAALGKGALTETMARSSETGEIEISDLFMGRSSGEIVFHMAYYMDRPGMSALNLVLTQNARDLVKAVDVPLADNWQYAILDPNGQYAAGTVELQSGQPFFLTRDQLVGDDALRTHFVRHDGERYLVSAQLMRPEGWTAVVWAPAAVVEAPLRRTWMLVALAGVLLILISIGAAGGGAIVLAKPIRHLARDARRLGAGGDVTARNSGIDEIDTVSRELAKAGKERARGEEEIRFLLKEVSHRAKNQLTVVGSIARQSLRASGADPSLSDALLQRINALSLSLDRLVGNRLNAADLRALVEIQLDSFLTGGKGQAVIEGPELDVSPSAAQALGLALHELATNASKYGALSVGAGTVTVDWEIVPPKDEDDLTGGMLILRWQEAGGPPVQQPTRTGFGTQIIETYLGAALGANVERSFETAGFACLIRMPVKKVRPDEEDQALDP